MCEVCEFEVLKLYTFTMILNITHRQVNICVCLAAHSMLTVLPLRSFCCVDALRFYIFLCYLLKLNPTRVLNYTLMKFCTKLIIPDIYLI